MKMERINVAAAIMVDGTTKMHCDHKLADITYDYNTQIYTLVGKTHGQITLVHSTNVQWSRPLKDENESKIGLSRSARTHKEA